MSDEPQQPQTSEKQVPTTDEVEAAKWYTIGFLIVLCVFTIGGILVMIKLAAYFLRT